MKGKSTSQMISAGKFWMRAYHRGDKTCYLCNFKVKGVPVYDLSEFLNKIAVEP